MSGARRIWNLGATGRAEITGRDGDRTVAAPLQKSVSPATDVIMGMEAPWL